MKAAPVFGGHIGINITKLQKITKRLNEFRCREIRSNLGRPVMYSWVFTL